ncbi:MAG: methyltransferase, partial [Thauera phenolivorans]|nr:methyltransferase [Thauera phenolivorans]
MEWTEDDETRSAVWRSESGAPAPRRVQVVDDTMTADTAFRLASEGTSLLWRGDYHNARQLLQAIARRIDERRTGKKPRKKPPIAMPEAFHLHRQAQAQRARTLGMLLLPFDGDYAIPLRRAPEVGEACTEAWGPAPGEPFVASLRELLG